MDERTWCGVVGVLLVRLGVVEGGGVEAECGRQLWCIGERHPPRRARRASKARERQDGSDKVNEESSFLQHHANVARSELELLSSLPMPVCLALGRLERGGRKPRAIGRATNVNFPRHTGVRECR